MATLWLSYGGDQIPYDKIEDNDLEKKFSSFHRNKGAAGEELQNEVIFSLLYYSEVRGRKDLRRIKRSDVSMDEWTNGWMDG